jgi:hypothetical protein
MNKDQRLLQEAYESIYEDSLTPSEQSLVRKAAKNISALYFRYSRRPAKILVLFKDFIELKDAAAILSSSDDIKNWIYDTIMSSLWDITFHKDVFAYRVSSREPAIEGTEENLEEFLFKAFSRAVLGAFASAEVYHGKRSAAVDKYIKTKRKLENKVNRELSKDFDIDLEDFA